MKIHFSIWACLALILLNSTLLISSTTPESAAIESADGAKKDAKELVELLPGRQLLLTVNDNNQTLDVKLSGAAENLEWVIFQPKGEVISRISTSSKIDEIKINNLAAGRYVLMIRDQQNRTLFKAFELN